MMTGGHVHSRTEPTTRTHIHFQSPVTVKRGAGMTGTAQFMARSILLQLIMDRSYTKLPMTSNPLYGCSLTQSRGISIHPHRKRSGTNVLPFETYLVNLRPNHSLEYC